jgi:hypothetical protein
MSKNTMKLPIDLIPNTNPPTFRWKTVVGTMDNHGHAIQDCEGQLPSTVETAVVELITIAKTLRTKFDGLMEVVAKQQKTIEELEQQIATSESAEAAYDHRAARGTLPPSPSQPKQNVAPQVTPLKRK